MPGQITTIATEQLSPERLKAHQTALSLLAALSLNEAGVQEPGTDAVTLTPGNVPGQYTVRGSFADISGLTSYNAMVGTALAEQTASPAPANVPPTPDSASQLVTHQV